MGAGLSTLAGALALFGLAGLAMAADATQAGGMFFKADGSFNTLALAATIAAGLLLVAIVRHKRSSKFFSTDHQRVSSTRCPFSRLSVDNSHGESQFSIQTYTNRKFLSDCQIQKLRQPKNLPPLVPYTIPYVGNILQLANPVDSMKDAHAKVRYHNTRSF